MDIKNIEQKYKTELAILRSKKEDLEARLKKSQELLKLSDEEFTVENVNKLHEKLNASVEDNKKKLESLIEDYETKTE